ncbi:MAG TPA: DUF6359 domain-containing protein [Bacteroidales bacterium]|nr:DUF6359 domain-containing protein [Bacteroidales bacterium]
MIKRLIFPVLIIAVILLSGLTSCVKQDFDKPPSKDIPVGKVITIKELTSMYQGQPIVFDTAMSTYGVVVGDESSGNIYKNSYVQDSTGAINLRLINPGGLYVGDSIRIYLKGLTLSDYGGVRQLDSVDVDLNIVKLKTKINIEPKVVTIPELAGGKYNSQLIMLENVEFSAADTAKTWSDPHGLTTQNRSLMDCDNNVVVVRTSGYANFAGVSLPNGNGTFVAIASIFNNTIQLYVRDYGEINLVGERCTGGGGGGGGQGSGTQSDPWNVAYGIANQNAMPYEVGWVKGYIVGSVKSGVTSITSNDDILYSPPFNLATNVLIADSPDEKNYQNCVIVNLPAGKPLRSEVNLVDHPDNLGKWLNVSGTLRTYFGAAGLRDSNGESSDFELEGGGGGGGGGTGSGTQSDPYNVEFGIANQNATPYIVGWIKGYIVGAVKSGVTSISSNDDILYDPPFDLATNVLIADSKEERNYQNCVIVNLPAGKPLRFDVNLVDHPENLGKWLKVKGTLRTYFGAAGLRDSSGEASDFELEGGGGGGGGTAFFSEDFNTNLGVFTAYSVTGDQVWGWGNFDGGCAVMSGYVQGTNYPNEDWLVSPAISLAGKTGVKIEFREAINYITNISDMKVLISTDYSGSGDPSINGTWTELQGFNRAPGNNWNFVNSGEVSLASYENKTVFIAFKYLSYSSGSATWEVSKVELRD